MSTTGERGRSTESKLRSSPPKPPTTLRQLGQQVAQGRKVTCIPPLSDVADHVTGYIGGWDQPTSPSANYLVFVPTERRDERGECVVESYLVPQAGTTVKMHEESTFEAEDAHPVLERRTRKFRNYVVNQVLANRGPASESA